MKPPKFWEVEIKSAEKRRERFVKRGDKIVRRFLAESENTTSETKRLNLFSSNVVTLRSMLFGSTPKVEVGRRYNDPNDDIARVASLIFSRVLNADITGPSGSFSTALRCVLDDRLLPGLGVARVRYALEETDEDYSESAEVEYVHWRDFMWGWARTWEEVPWVAFASYLSKKECEERFGEAKASTLEFSKPSAESEKGDDDSSAPWKRARILEIWHKRSRKVYWYSSESNTVLDERDDPYGLEQFFPCPRPLIANATTNQLMPLADYMLAQDLYDEIDYLEERIINITRAIRAVGTYDKSTPELRRVLTDACENELIPVDNWAQFSEKGGIDGAISWMPLEALAGTLDKLRALRDENIALLYQVTGMSDILRGHASGSRVTATEQSLKAKFGSIRIQALQDEFANFASDLQRLRAELIANHFEDQTILAQSNIAMSVEGVEILGPALSLIRSDQREWRIEIRPESVAMVDYAQVRAERSEYLNTLAVYLQSAQAMAKEMPGSVPMLLEIMKWGMMGFKGSNEIEGVVDKTIDGIQQAQKQQASQPPQPDPVQQAQLAEKQQSMQFAQEDHKMEILKAIQELRQEAQKFAIELEKTRVDQS